MQESFDNITKIDAEMEIADVTLFSCPGEAVTLEYCNYGDDRCIIEQQNGTLRIRREYPAGTRVELVRMDDAQAPPVGTKGTVRGVDDIGSIMVAGRVISDRVNAASAAQTALKNIVFVGANATVRGYSVTYEKDGGTGDVPVDATMYADGEIVQLSKSYPLTKSSKSQIGWALSSGGNAVDTVTIAGADVKVYPVFEA